MTSARLLAAVVLLSGALSAQRLEFTPLPQATIEERLKENRDKAAERQAALEKLFATAGCQSQPQKVKLASHPNVICTLPGTGDGVILVGAHYDHVAIGDGVVDNWSGASLLPSLYQTLKDKPRKHSFIFIGFTNEEKGLVGSRFYAEHMSDEEKARAQAMINLDTLGLAPTEVWLSHADPKLAEGIALVARAMKLPIAAVNVEQVGTADSESFEPLKIPRMTVHSVTQDNWHILHSRDDKLSAIKLDDYYGTYRLLAAYLIYLDQTLTAATKP